MPEKNKSRSLLSFALLPGEKAAQYGFDALRKVADGKFYLFPPAILALFGGAVASSALLLLLGPVDVAIFAAKFPFSSTRRRN